MAINPSLLIAAPILQDYFVDKDDGTPLSAGIVTLYSETQRSVLKPWYMQQGTNPDYSYVELPNPMTLSAVGTIQDVNGNDVIPFFYPYESDNTTFDSYYITVQDSDLELQFTRSNFPFVANPSSTLPVATNANIITNSVFWRNLGTTLLNSTTMANSIIINGVNLNYATLAPSQHDGNTMPDINYFKNATDGTETISFPTFVSNFSDNVLIRDITPEYYMNINCSNPGTATTRYLQFPLSLHIDSLSGFSETSFTLQAMSVDGLSETLTVGIFQFCGSGVTSPAVSVTTINLGQNWNKFIINLPIPSAQGVTIGNGGDDALYVQIGFPNTAFNVNIALPSFYLNNTPATNSFQTYDDVNAIASSPRTGDTRTSLNSFSPYGWVPANDKTIGSASSGATGRANIDTWQLYKLIYTSVLNTFAPVSGGRTAPGNTPVAAYADFNANKPMALTKALGRILMAMPTVSTFNYVNTGVCTVVSGDSSIYYFGAPVVLSNVVNTPFVAGTIYYMIPINSTTFSLSATQAGAIARTAITGGVNGSATMNFSFGGTFGENIHVPTIAETASHHHDPLTGGVGFDVRVLVGGDSNFSGGTQNRSDATTGNTGGSSAFNIETPATFMNVFLKL